MSGSVGLIGRLVSEATAWHDPNATFPTVGIEPPFQKIRASTTTRYVLSLAGKHQDLDNYIRNPECEVNSGP